MLLQGLSLPKIEKKTGIKDILTLIKLKKNQFNNQLQGIKQQQSSLQLKYNSIRYDHTSYLEKIDIQQQHSHKNKYQLRKSTLKNQKQENSLQQKNHFPTTKRNIHQSVSEMKKHQQIQQKKKSVLKKNQNNLQLISLLTQFPQLPKDKNQQILQKLLRLLIEQNIFFAKVNPIICLCLLKMNRIIHKPHNFTLYRTDQQHHSLYIIILGKVKLTNKESGMRKDCRSGQTIGQQLIFSQKFKKYTLQKAKTITQSYFLEIRVQNYKKMLQQMMKWGYKVPFLQMQAAIKRNFIIKNWKRSKAERLYTKN